MKYNTLVVASNPKGEVLWTARTRRDLEKRLNKQVSSRNEDSQRWHVKNPAGVNSLCEVDEVRCGIFNDELRLNIRLERLVSGNAKQRRKFRRLKSA